MGWNNLPSVVLVDIYKHLSTSDRLNASSICFNWRIPVFQMPLQETLTLNIGNYETDSCKYQFLSSYFSHKVTHVSLTFDGASPNCMDLVCDTLTKLERNTALKTLRIRCTEESIGKDILYGTSIAAQLLQKYFTKKVVQPLLAVLERKNSLETFSFPLIQQLSQQQLNILETLTNSASKNFSLRNLFLATIRTPQLFKMSLVDGSGFPIPESPIEPTLFNKFCRLQMLAVDHDVLTDAFLSSLAKGGQSGGLTQLNLIAVQPNPRVSNVGWTNFVVNNPNCKVRLTVMGSKALVELNSNLCFPSTPLTHFRALYCQGIRMNMLNSIILWNERRLEHLELVNENQDWLENIVQSANQLGDDFIDPIIYAAWRVKTLRTIKIGYLYCGNDIIGVAKLSGSLKCLEIPKSQILHRNIETLTAEVSKALGKPWAPIDDGFGPGKSRSQILRKRMSSSFEVVVLDENY